MAEQLNGLAGHAALALTIEDESDLGLVELGSQALESFPGSVAVLSLSPGIAEGNATRLQDMRIPFGFAVHQYIESSTNEVT